MSVDAPTIKAIPYPDCVAPYLEHLDRRLTELKSEDFEQFVESGFFLPNTRIPENLFREYLIYLLVETLNGVIESMNLIMADLSSLPSLIGQLRGSYSKRVELLVRIFYAEFFRGREVTRKILAEFRRRGYVDREVVKSIVASLDQSLGDIVRTRNALVHGDAGFTGFSHHSLRLLEARIPEDVSAMMGNLGVALDPAKLMALTCEECCRDKVKAMEAYSQVFRAAYKTVVDILAALPVSPLVGQTVPPSR